MNWRLFFILTLMPLLSFGQDLVVDGYVKYLHMYFHPKEQALLPDMDDMNTKTLHNRLNINWYINDNIGAQIGIRNRFIHGNLIKNIPFYKKIIDIDSGIVDCSWTIVSDDSWLLHSIIDRAYVDFTFGDLQVRAGRQRINWGISMVWNPNDIFNSFSFFDFDYEERPGSDALKLEYYTGATSSLQLVFKLGKSSDNNALAALYRFSRWEYDFQLLTGYAGADYIIGTGWTGNIAGGGFHGEMTYFKPRPNKDYSQEAFVASLSYDYTLKSNIYLSVEGLFNSRGATSNAAPSNVLYQEDLSAKRLSNAKYAVFGQVSYPFTPLVSASLSSILNPNDHSWFLNPAIMISLTENIELMLTGQLFFGNDQTEFGDIGQLAFGRLRWSF
ncbi:hypothetical protein EYV94_15655 [Puteibacter caeruleilacunae]|nr:hypothetical protein EYV94_15655 [Puteibacter caeruleilacunae]